MKFGRLLIENFFKADKILLNLSNRGLVLVEGVNEDSSAADSNGAGKSTLFEAIVWCLYGKTIRGLSGDEIVKKKNCQVRLELIDEDSTFVITRFRKHKTYKNDLFITINNKDIRESTTKTTQEQIDNIMGMDFVTCCQSLVFGQGQVLKFALATDAEKKKILDNIVSIYDFDDFLGTTKKKVTELSVELTTVSTTLNNWGDKSLTAQEDLEDLQSKSADYENVQRSKIFQIARKVKDEQDVQRAQEEESNKEIVRLQELVRTLKEEAIQQTNKVTKSISDKSAEVTKWTKELVTYETNITGWNTQLDALNTQRGENKSKCIEAKHDLVQYEGRLKDLQSKKLLGQECPECGRVVKEADIQKFSNRIIPKIENLKQTITNLSLERAVIDKQIKTAHDGKTSNETVKKAAETNVLSLTQEISSLTTQKESYSQVDSDIVGHKKTIEYHETQKVTSFKQATDRVVEYEKEAIEVKKETSPYRELIQKQDKVLINLDKQFSDLQGQQTKLQTDLKYFEFWITGFGNRGLKSFIFDAVTPYLTERANHYSRLLTGGEIEIDFATTSKIKSGESREKFSVNIVNHGGSSLYEGNSGGEKGKIDLCISLALQDLVASRSKKSFNVLFMDEVFANIDERGVESIMDLLNEKGKERESIFVITHLPVLKSCFNSVITVKKKNGVSQIG